MTNKFQEWLERKKACTPGIEWVEWNNIQSVQELWEKCDNVNYLVWLIVKQKKNLKVLKFFLKKVSEDFECIDVKNAYKYFTYDMPQTALNQIMIELLKEYDIGCEKAERIQIGRASCRERV